MTETNNIPELKEKVIETHPFDPFLPQHAKVLIMGTFPPKEERWTMKFYYPNKINDFWRVIGIVFFNNRDRFVDVLNGKFRLDDIKNFLTERGIALSDTGFKICRLRDNASDKYLDIMEPVNLRGLLDLIPDCRVLAATGEKAAQIIGDLTGLSVPKVGEFTEGDTKFGRRMRLYRMPSTSRAYPLPLEKKAEIYRSMFSSINML
ncbi:MAG: uracil-DNA glycosylase family protein [Muribaculaceae bacterium]|nr:uracil-DNA glycosylase family protein [Muribaculaceae bacterium]